MPRIVLVLSRPLVAVLLCLSMLVAASVLAVSSASADTASSALQAQLDAVLAKVAGPGKGFVVVSQNAKLDHTTLERLRYGHAGVALTVASSRTRWRGATSGSVDASDIQWGNDETVSRTVVAPGAVKRLDIALVLDRSIPKATARRIATALATASGLRRSRGDRLTLLRTKLPPQAVARRSTASWVASLKPHAQPIALAAAIAGFTAFMAWTIARSRRTTA
jgi:flagellar M-ring protein FliF